MSEPFWAKFLRACGMYTTETVTFATTVDPPGFEFTEGPSDDNILRQMLASPFLSCEIEGPAPDQHGQMLTAYRFTPTGLAGEGIIRSVMRQIDPNVREDAPAKSATVYRYGEPARML